MSNPLPASDQLRLRRVRVRVHGATDGARARRCLESALAELSFAGLGLPPRALLMVKRLAPPVALRPAEADGALALGRAAQAELEHQARRAVRPWHVPWVAEEAVLFADEAELAACLIRDWLRGGLNGSWWARAVLDGQPPPAWWRRDLLPRGDLLPPVIAHLAAQGEALAWVAHLDHNASATAARAVAVAHGLTAWLPDAGLGSVGLEKPPDQSPHQDTTVIDKTGRELVRIIPEVLAATGGAPARRLIALALGLQRAPGWVRGDQVPLALESLARRDPEFGRSDGTIRGRSTAARIAASSAATNPGLQACASAEDRVLATDCAAVRVSVPDTPANQTVVRAPLATPGRPQPSIRVCAPIQGDSGAARGPELDRREPDDGAPATVYGVLPRSEPGPAEGAAPVPTSLSPGPPIVQRSLFSSAAAPSPTAPSADPDVAPALAIVTAYGGLFYLLNPALALGLYGDFTQPLKPGIALSPWDWLALIGRTWFGRPIVRDPVWGLLARLAGRRAGQAPGSGFAPPRDWLVSSDWPAPWGLAQPLEVQVRGSRLRLRHPAGFLLADLPRVPGLAPLAQARDLCGRWPALGEARCGVRPLARPNKNASPTPCVATNRALARWMGRLLPYLNARLALALGAADPRRVPALVCRHQALVYCSATALDLHLSLEELPIELRIAGLDRDPGWIPAADRSVAFHFV